MLGSPAMPGYKPLKFCKPCWELKYCPYGVLVELMPFPDSKDMEQRMADSGVPGWTPELLFANAKRHLSEAVNGGADDNELWKAMFGVIGSDPEQSHYLDQFNPRDIRCNIFGHVCPAFAYAYLNVTETREVRKTGRHVPRDVMMKVIRRDDYRCRVCDEHVRDDEVEFDHVIPHAKGGPMSVENIRLLCRACNRKKSDSLGQILRSEEPIE
jgi:hypothetical protein